MTLQAATENAAAKVNLALHVTGRRPDGFHTLESLVVFAEIADELEAVPSAEDRLAISGPFASALTSGQSNLVLKAISAFREYWPSAVDHGVAVELRKNLPVAAGVGGGSADAAAALRLMAAFSRIPVRIGDLSEIAAVLGADVPVCLNSAPSLMSGIGEIVHPLADFPACHIVLVNPLVPIPTADVFRRLKLHENPGLPPLDETLRHTAMLALWLQETRNDLEEAAMEIAPVIGEITTALRRTNGCIAARMSGSGATVFGLYGSAMQAHQAARDIRARWPDFWVSASPLTVSS